ncbi:putative phosphatidate phosphatase isoform X2 [Drosophila novamexicana]|uniref:putative phosphatidate phosphatase isoform X2 n=1 Tax=Drosophila novamexicana TaxID=47314 RepID=UPI0011E5E9E8|nr:putative phosphatidate phosphatase isoform X2 [Drosophila novamexicana]
MSSLRTANVCDTTPLQRFESQSSSGEEPSSPTAASIIAAAAAAAAASTSNSPHRHQHQHSPHNNNNNINNNVKVDLQLPPFVGAAAGAVGGVGGGGTGTIVTMPRARGTAHIFGRIVMDLSLLSCVGLTMLAFSLWCEPIRRGFFCGDLSLMHPYKESTIRSWMLYLMCAALPVSVILLVEFYRAQDKPKYAHGQIGSGYYLCHMELPQWVLQCYRKIGAFVFGLGVEQLTTDIAKYAIGRLRPHFFALCQPVLRDGTSCNDAINAGRFIEDFQCTASSMSAKRLKDMHLSFPSGHASFACYSMVYLVIYLQRRMHWSRLKMLRHLLQFLLLMFAWYTALTRVSDYKHHWSDVLAGGAIGLTYALVVTSIIW